MKSASNGGVLKGSLQVLHVHVLLVAPPGANHMGATADFSVEHLNDLAAPQSLGNILHAPDGSRLNESFLHLAANKLLGLPP